MKRQKLQEAPQLRTDKIPQQTLRIPQQSRQYNSTALTKGWYKSWKEAPKITRSSIAIPHQMSQFHSNHEDMIPQQ